MSLKIRPRSVIICVLVLPVLGLLGIIFPPEQYEKRGLSDGVNAERLMRIELGFSESEVISILGRPLEILSDAGDNMSYLYYSKCIKWTFWQPKVWIVLKHGKVIAVRVQKMALWGDEFDSDFYNKNEYGLRQSKDFEKYFDRQVNGH